MKRLKTAMLPIAIALVGVGSAFATQAKEESTSMDIQGHLFRPDEEVACQPVSKWCDNTGVYDCTSAGTGTESLYIYNGTICPNVLKHSVPN